MQSGFESTNVKSIGGKRKIETRLGSRLLLMAFCAVVQLVQFAVVGEPAQAKGEFIRETFAFEGFPREYYVHAPPGYDPAKPISVVLLFHSLGSKASEIAKITGMSELSDKYGFLLVVPESVRGSWYDGRRVDVSSQYNDVGFVNELINVLEHKWNADKQAIYAAGFGNGGFFSQYLAIKMPGRIAGIASVAATLPQVVASTLKLKQAVSIIFILGMNDEIVPWTGGMVMEGRKNTLALSASQVVDYWVKVNKCPGPVETHELPDLDPNDQTVVKIASYSACSNDTEVVVFGVQGGGHAWPHSGAYDRFFQGRSSKDFDASEAICQFFDHHGLTQQR